MNVDSRGEHYIITILHEEYDVMKYSFPEVVRTMIEEIKKELEDGKV